MDGGFAERIPGCNPEPGDAATYTNSMHKVLATTPFSMFTFRVIKNGMLWHGYRRCRRMEVQAEENGFSAASASRVGHEYADSDSRDKHHHRGCRRRRIVIDSYVSETKAEERVLYTSQSNLRLGFFIAMGSERNI